MESAGTGPSSARDALLTLLTQLDDPELDQHLLMLVHDCVRLGVPKRKPPRVRLPKRARHIVPVVAIMPFWVPHVLAYAL